MSNDLKGFQKEIGVKIKDSNLLREALTHRSYGNENSLESNWNNNERLEFLGDAVLELTSTQLLFHDYPETPEGKLTSYRSALVRTESLAEEATRLSFGKYIYMSNGEEATGGRQRPYILANTFEAVIGCIYLDQGLKTALEFVKKNVYYKIESIIKNNLDIDPKSRFQELTQDKLRITPSYKLISEEGPDHQKSFKMGVMLEDKIVGKGVGDSKQNAEQNAAQLALENWAIIQKKFFSNK